jgi:mitochondrial inner membrane protease subunit 1
VCVGDVVASAHPLRPGEGVVKRVLAMPGDWVRCLGEGEVDAPGSMEGIAERHGDGGSGIGDGEGEVAGEKASMIMVPSGHCWLAGDSCLDSFDSRHYGPVPLALVTGKVEAVLWWEGWRLHWERLRNGMEAVD